MLKNPNNWLPLIILPLTKGLKIDVQLQDTIEDIYELHALKIKSDPRKRKREQELAHHALGDV